MRCARPRHADYLRYSLTRAPATSHLLLRAPPSSDVRNKTGATTRLSTTDRFGTRYHVFAHTYTEQELLHKVRPVLASHLRFRFHRLNCMSARSC